MAGWALASRAGVKRAAVEGAGEGAGEGAVEAVVGELGS